MDQRQASKSDDRYTKSMSTNSELLARREQAVARGVANMHNIYAARAENAEVWDVEGKRYIDFAGGIGVLNTGHRHPKVMAAVQEQINRYTHTCFQVLPYEPYIELAERLNRLAPGSGPNKTLFLTTGAEAVENAVKIARAYTGRSALIAFNGGYPGSTMMTLGLTGKVLPYKAGFGPFPAEIFHAPFPIDVHGMTSEQSLAAVHNIFKFDVEASRVAAIIVEPVQGEGGFYVAPFDFLQELRALCDEHGILLIADEVQAGEVDAGGEEVRGQGGDEGALRVGLGNAGGVRQLHRHAPDPRFRGVAQPAPHRRHHRRFDQAQHGVPLSQRPHQLARILAQHRRRTPGGRRGCGGHRPMLPRAMTGPGNDRAAAVPTDHDPGGHCRDDPDRAMSSLSASSTSPF